MTGCGTTRAQTTLLATARPGIAPNRAALAGELSSFDEEDWSALVELALRHGTTPLLCRQLLELGQEVLPADLVRGCNSYLATREKAVANAMAQLASILDALACEGIEALPFKGPVLGLQAYGNPTLREFRDLDLLIRREDIAGTLALLDRLGYHSPAIDGLRARRVADYYDYNGHDILFAPDGLPLEPHWTLTPRTFCAEMDTAPVFSRAARLTAGDGRVFPCFSPEDAFLAAAVHGGKEQWARLMWVADVAALIEAHPLLDWTAILERARRVHCLRMALLAAALASSLLEATLPAEVHAAIGRDPAVPRLVQRVRAALFDGREPPPVYVLSPFRRHIRERWIDRVRYVWRTVLVARVPHFRTVDLPDPLSFLYPAVRLGHDFVALPVWKALSRKAN